jgi:probable phosphoglycerate mutase
VLRFVVTLLAVALPREGAAQATDTLRIYVARHGQTDWNVEGRLQGGIDTPLNTAGKQQALELAERLNGVALDAVYSSGLQRSRETAALAARGTPLTSVPGFNERRLGKYEGQKLAYSTTSGSARRGTTSDDPLTREYERRRVDPHDTLDGGESAEQFAARVSDAVKSVLAAQRTGTILIVGHSMTNQMILKAILGLTLEQGMGIQMSNEELYLIEIGGGAAPRLWKRVTAGNLDDL